MKPITFTKSFIFDDSILKIGDIVVEDDFSYDLLDSDLKISGKIFGSGSAKGELDSYPFTFEISVDCLLSLAKIDCLTDLKLSFKDYKYAIDGKLVTLTFRYALFGNGEPYVDVVKNENVEFQRNLYEAINSKINTTTKPHLDEALKDEISKIISEDVEMISTLDELSPQSSLSELVEDDELVLIEEEPVIIPLVEPIDVNEVQEVSRVEVREDNKEDETVPVKTNTLFTHETYEVSHIYYKVQKDESIESIARKFSRTPDEIKKVNKERNVSPGQLLLIPSK